MRKSPRPSPTSSKPARRVGELQRRRDRLAEQVTELHWDLGGLAYATDIAQMRHETLEPRIFRS